MSVCVNRQKNCGQWHSQTKIFHVLTTDMKGWFAETETENSIRQKCHVLSNSSQHSGGFQSHMASEGCQRLIFTSISASVPLVCAGIRSFCAAAQVSLFIYRTLPTCLLYIALFFPFKLPDWEHKYLRQQPVSCPKLLLTPNKGKNSWLSNPASIATSG